MKKIYSIVVMILIMTLLSSTVAFASTTAIKVTVNSKTVKYDVKPYMQGKEVMIPVKQTSEALGAEVETDKKSNTVWVNLGMMHIEFPIGKSEFYIHRDADFSGIPQTVKLNTPIKNSKGKTFVPGKSVFEAIGMTVSWDSKKRILSIKNTNSTGVDLSKDISYTEITKDDISDSKEVYKWYNTNFKKSGIHYTKQDGVIYVLVGAGSKPTGGYTIGINQISYDTENKAFVSAYFKGPAPDMMVTQAETFPHMLIKIVGCKNIKKLGGKVTEMTNDTVPAQVSYDEIFVDDIKGNTVLTNWYNENNQKKGISFIRDGNYVYAIISAGEKPTGGYTISIDNVFYSTDDTVTINARVNPPGDNVRVMMVISYPSTLIRIKSDTIKTVIGEIVDASAPSKEKWITMDLTTVTKMELFSLEQVKLRDITGTEKDNIMKSFNESTLDPNSYVKMIAGGILKVTTNDGYVLTFTSYGSETNAIVNFEKDGESRTFHLQAPIIAKTLLAV